VLYHYRRSRHLHHHHHHHHYTGEQLPCAQRTHHIYIYIYMYIHITHLWIIRMKNTVPRVTTVGDASAIAGERSTAAQQHSSGQSSLSLSHSSRPFRGEYHDACYIVLLSSAMTTTTTIMYVFHFDFGKRFPRWRAIVS